VSAAPPPPGVQQILRRFRKRRTLVDALDALGGERELGVTIMPNWREETFCAYGELRRKALLMLGALQDAGLRPGQEVVFQLADEDSFITLFWACLLGRFLPVPVTLGYHEEFRFKLYKILHQLEEPFLAIAREDLWSLKKFSRDHGLAEAFEALEPRALIVEELAEWRDEGKRADIQPDSLAFIQYSSGSTGDPKGVMLTHGNLKANIEAIIEGSRLTAEDRTLSWMPLTHDMGLIGFHLTPLAAGVSQWLMPPSRFLRNSVGWLEKAHQYRTTILASPNFGYRHFLNYFMHAQERDWDLSSVRLILNGAEPISADLAEDFLRTLAPFGLKPSAMFPVYGMAEASLAVTFPPVGESVRAITADPQLAATHTVDNLEQGRVRSGASFVDLGYPVRHCRVRVCDDRDAPIAEDRIGHIQIKGANVTPGYYQNEAATRNAFTDDGWFRTGDLGFMRGGRLVVTGRTKDVIFKHGVNYFSHDLERVCEEVEGVPHGRAMVCGVFREDLSRNEVIAFIQCRNDLESFAQIALRLKKYVGKHMGLDLDAEIPVPKLPRTTSGKLKRYLLADKYAAGEYDQIVEKLRSLLAAEERNRRVIRLQTNAQERLAALWREVLGDLPINPKDNFFEMGGDSLKASGLAVKIGQTFRVKISLKEIFDSQTLERMAERIEHAREHDLPVIAVSQAGPSFPLTSEQRRLFFIYQLHKSSLAYNLYLALDAKGQLDPDALTRAFRDLTARHDILRVGFEARRGDPVQTLFQSPEVAVNRAKLQGSVEETLSALPSPFDLSAPPLIRLHLLEVAPLRWVILLEAHHIVCDGESLAILTGELFALYGGERLPPLPLQFRDFAVWQKGYLAQGFIESQRRYWMERLDGELPILQLTTDYPRPSVRDERGARVCFTLRRDLTQALKALGQRRQTTLSMTVLTLFKCLLAQYAGQEDLIVGTALNGRNHPGVEKLVGMFVKTVALRTRFAAEAPFVELLEQVKQRFFEAHANQDYPFEQIVEALGGERDLSRTPLVEALFVSQNFSIPRVGAAGLELTERPFYQGQANFDLVLEIRERDSELHCVLEYASALFQRRTIIWMARHLRLLAKQAVTQPDIRYGDLTLASPAELRRTVQKFNRTEAVFPADLTLDAAFEAAAHRFAERDALIHGHLSLSYREVNELADRLAYRLRLRGVGPETVVGALAKPSFELMVGVLAILKAGGAFMPIDPDYPDQRKAFMLDQCRAGLLLARAGEKDIPERACDAIWFDCLELAADGETPKPSRSGGSDGLAYVIFTSGSTGRPKGVWAEHRGLVNFLHFISTHYPTGPGDVWLCKTAFTFDAAMHDLFLWHWGGGTGYIAPENLDMEPRALFRTFCEHNVTHAIFAPSTLQFWFDALEERDFQELQGVTFLFVGGEPLPTPLANAVVERMPNLTLVNCYGPTETTVTATLEPVSLRDPASRAVIGRPIQNVQILILNAYGRLQPVGAPGEICIAGAGLTRGYVGSPQLNAVKFVPSGYVAGGILYRSGDMGRWAPDGRIEFLGRLDHQVKVRGYRIELGEVEAALREHPRVARAVVLDKIGPDGRTALCAYYVAQGPVAAAELRDLAESRLPEYMAPSYFFQLDAIPLKPSGKIDRGALPEPGEAGAIRAEYEPPANKFERAIVEVWQDVLGVERVGARDHFFALGGHSLLAAKALDAIRKRTGAPIEVKAIFEAPRVRELASLIAREIDRHGGGRILAGVAELQRETGLEAKLKVFKTEEGERRILFVDAKIEDLLDSPYFCRLNPDYVRPFRLAGHLPEQQNLSWPVKRLAAFLELSQVLWQGAQLEWRFRLRQARQEYRRHLTARPLEAEYIAGHHPNWFAKRYGKRDRGTALFAEFHCERAASRARFLEEVNRFIRKQALLRAVLIRDGEEDPCRFCEYEPSALAELPFFDFSHCVEAVQARGLERLRQTMSEDLLSEEPFGAPLFNVALARLSLAEHRLIFVFNHIIADHDCTRVVQYHFRGLNDPPPAEPGQASEPLDYAVESYRKFTELCRPRSEDDPRVARFKAMPEYTRFRDLTVKLHQRIGLGEPIVLSSPFLLELSLGEQASREAVVNYMGLGLSVAAQAIALVFQLDEMPLRVLANRRIFGGLNFYNTVGDFHDSVPVVFPAENLTPESAYQKLRQVERKLSNSGLYISDYGRDAEIRRAIFKSPFNFNYVGELTPEEEKTTLGKAGPLPFVAYPVFAYRRDATLRLVFLHGFEEANMPELHALLDGVAERWRLRRLGDDRAN